MSKIRSTKLKRRRKASTQCWLGYKFLAKHWAEYEKLHDRNVGDSIVFHGRRMDNNIKTNSIRYSNFVYSN